MDRKTIAKLLVVCLLLAMLPMGVLAANNNSGFEQEGSSYSTATNLTEYTYTVSGSAYIVGGSTLTDGVYVVKGGSTADEVTITGGTYTVSNSAYLVFDSVKGVSGTVSSDADGRVIYTSSADVTGLTFSRSGYDPLWADGDDTWSGAKVLTWVAKDENPGNSSGGTVTGGGATTGGNTGGDDASEAVTTNDDGTVTAEAAVEVETKVETTTASDGTVTAAVAVKTPTEKAITDAVAAAVKAAEDSGASKAKTEVVVTIDVAADVEEGVEVTEVTVSPDLFTMVADNEDADALAIQLTSAEVKLDTDALAAIAEAAGDEDITLNVESTEGISEALSEEQTETVEGLDTAATFSVEITAGDKPISEFGGEITWSFPFTPPPAKPAHQFFVYFVPDRGPMQPQPTSFKDGKLSFRTGHNSDYVAIFEPFTDVKATDWFAKNVQYVFDNKVVDGDTDAKGEPVYRPQSHTLRDAMVQVLWKAEGSKTAAAASFTDVKATDWFAKAVNWAAEFGVTTGSGDGTIFEPEKEMTREQLAQFLYNYAKLKGDDVSKKADLSAFPDADSVSEWHVDAMQWAVAEGIISGDENPAGGADILNPQGTSTRAVLATVLARYLAD